jgi:hypothetical protein
VKLPKTIITGRVSTAISAWKAPQSIRFHRFFIFFYSPNLYLLDGNIIITGLVGLNTLKKLGFGFKSHGVNRKINLPFKGLDLDYF